MIDLENRWETLPGLLEKRLSRDPDRVYVSVGGKPYSYADIDRESNRMACGFLAEGLRPGDRVATMLDNRVEAIVILFAAAKTGIQLVPLNTALRSEYLHRPLTDSEATILVTESAYLDRVLELEDRPGALRTILYCDEIAPPPHFGSIEVERLDGIFASPEAKPTHASQPSDVAMILYTSGTTGVSKGCMLSQNYICNIARMSIKAVGQTSDDILWTALPLFHINAMGTLLAALIVGAKAVFERRFSLSGFWPSIEASGATVTSLLGSMAPLIAAAEDTEASRRCHGQLRIVIGAPFSTAMRERWKARFGVGRIVVPGFGQTEAALITSAKAGVAAPDTAAGRRNEDFEVRIVDDQDRELPVGTAGELICRPRFPHIMFEGYWRLPEKTAEISRNGWYHTGDIGKFDEDGYFYFLGRKAEYLRCRGENVSALEVEGTLLQNDALEDVAIIPVKSPMGEDDIMLAATIKPRTSITEESLHAWAAARLPGFAVPSYIEFLDELPRNGLGKVEKFKLTARGPSARAWVSPRLRRERDPPADTR